MRNRSLGLALALLAVSGCGGQSMINNPVAPNSDNTAPTRMGGIAHQAAVVGTPFEYDVSAADSVFVDIDGDTLDFTIRITPLDSGLSVSGSWIRGTPTSPGPITASVEVRDGRGGTASQSFTIIAFAADLAAPTLPDLRHPYADAAIMLPAHYVNPNAPFGNVAATDNTPAANATTDAGATLGRVLFYDRRLSINDAISCASCHDQQRGFADARRLSVGFAGGQTGRHSMGLANARYYQNGRAFWDERAASFEAQALAPIQDPVEMGMTLDLLTTKLRLTDFYPALFEAAFGTPEITSDRVARAIAQFVRSMSSYGSKFDEALATAPPGSNLTALEQMGMQLFFSPPPGAPPNGPSLRCDACHRTSALALDRPRNNGLDANTAADQGVGNGRFKSPSLRNIAARGPYMHDGRFATLEEVVEFYNSGVQAHPNLDPALRNPDGTPRRLNLTAQQKSALVAFLETLTDPTLLSHAKFSNPF